VSLVVCVVCYISFVVRVALSVILLLAWCVILCDMCICVLCLTVVSLVPVKNPFAVQLNNNNKNYISSINDQVLTHAALNSTRKSQDATSCDI
jgi:type IV secretory pathway component VirB8